MAKTWAAVLAVVLSAAAGARAQPPTTLPMPAEVARPEQAPAPEMTAPPAGVAPGGPGCAGGCCGHEQVGCLKRFCNWITYHPLTRGCGCGCGCGCCSDCCGYHGFQPLYTYLQLPCQGGHSYGPAAQPDCACGGHGLLFKWGLCKGCHGGPILPPGIE